MENLLISIDYRDPLWIAIAFLFGFAFKYIKLPPMLGFLFAGFILHALGAEKDQFISEIADMGVTLLLFTIGLKLRLGTLIRPEIWATTVIHMSVITLMTAGAMMVLAWPGVLLFDGIDPRTAIVVAFALSFSSTVFAVKTLEDRGARASRYGQVAVGVLIMQDIAAVAFLAISAGKIPSPWALGLFALIPARHLLALIMAQCGHKELLTVFGFVMALGGAALFEIVGMKGDLGALILGVLLAPYAKSDELAKTLLGFKDVFLVCFFLTIGLTGLPTWETFGTAVIIMFLIPLKVALFFWLLTWFRLRARGATLGSMILGNFSEFGLIVAAIAISRGWLPTEWITVIALALSISFLIAAPFNQWADEIYDRYRRILRNFESPKRLPGDDNIKLRGMKILVFGMGRVGRAAYDEMRTYAEDHILGVDLDEEQVAQNRNDGRNVVLGDATHPEFWARLDDGHVEIELILLAMPNVSANADAAKRLRDRGYQGPLVATALYADQEEYLLENGIDEVFNIYAEAGAGAAGRMQMFIDQPEPETQEVKNKT